jgi:predicted ribosome quality control (RQC) complex YloA/Tae2 family protein
MDIFYLFGNGSVKLLPFDGVVTKAVADELNMSISGGRIFKIYQPDKDSLVFHIRTGKRNVKLFISSNANSARVHLTEIDFENPASPPMFCMLLRKHLSGGKVVDIQFHDYERIITINIEAIDELGDKNIKKLVIEIMGRHSNIILLNPAGKIIDAIKHVDQGMSRVREVMPARQYLPPPAQEKFIPSKLDFEKFISSVSDIEKPFDKILLSSILGFSPVLCREICHRAGIDPDLGSASSNRIKLPFAAKIMKQMVHSWEERNYSPCVVYDDKTGKPLDFHAVSLSHYGSFESFPTISNAIDQFYRVREIKNSIKKKASDLNRIVRQNIERCEKKIQIHIDTLERNSDPEIYRLYGELITANIHNLSKGIKKCSLLNYYDPEQKYIEIELDENRTPQENAQWYYKKYGKAKITRSYAMEQLKLARGELEYLDNVLYSIEEAESAESIEQIREELRAQGYIHKTNNRRKPTAESLPLKFITSEGYPVWVGRNNIQNDELTLKRAKPTDMWLHTKNIPGSHVIARIPDPIPDASLLEAARLAAWFSRARNTTRVEVDYTRVKYVRKPTGAKPGMVIYTDYNTVIVDPEKPESSIETN